MTLYKETNFHRYTAEERFWSWVDRTGDGCWLWLGHVDHDGYGRFRLDGRRYKAPKCAWILEVGPVPDGLIIRHDCDNPACCNPGHLQLGTHRDNAADKIARGRCSHYGPPQPRGEASPHAKLSDAAAREILHRVLAGERQQLLADEFGVHARTVSNIKLGRRGWADEAA